MDKRSPAMEMEYDGEEKNDEGRDDEEEVKDEEENNEDKDYDTNDDYGDEDEQVIQGLHMVSGTRCPAWSDQLKRWSESRAAAPKGRCPAPGEFPYILRRHISGLKGNFP